MSNERNTKPDHSRKINLPFPLDFDFTIKLWEDTVIHSVECDPNARQLRMVLALQENMRTVDLCNSPKPVVEQILNFCCSSCQMTGQNLMDTPRKTGNPLFDAVNKARKTLIEGIVSDSLSTIQ